MRRATQSHFIFTLTALPLLCASSTRAYEFRVRWVERVGTVDVVLGGPNAWLEDGTSSAHRIRLQFGVFDDASGTAPDGGFLGWNVGTISISGNPDNSAERRTPGRLAPFNFASGPNANGNPPPAGGVNMGDAPGTDFQGWTDIDATLGTQPFVWGFDANGDPLPQPTPVIRGMNRFVSVFEMTVDPSAFFLNYLVSVGGNLIAATNWQVVGTPIPPDPDTHTPGSIIYAPLPTDPQSFTASLLVTPCPAPGAGSMLVVSLLALRRRRPGYTSPREPSPAR